MSPKKLVTVLLLAALGAKAQKIELGLSLGACNYWGDLAPELVQKETNACGGLFARINFNTTWAWNNQINLYKLTGSDQNFTYNNFRNLNFRTNVTELASVFEFNFLKYGPGVLDKNFTSYVYAGVALFSFNPQAELPDQNWYDLRVYETEGVAYNTYSYAIPFGIGIKAKINRKFSFESQIGFRRTFTDYLDDVSTVYPDMTALQTDKGVIAQWLTDGSAYYQGNRNGVPFGTPMNKTGYKRGDPSYNDWYMNWTVSLVWRIWSRSKCARFY